MNIERMPDKITIRVQDTPSGHLLARAMQIMNERACTMGEAMDLAQAEAAVETFGDPR